MAMAEIRGARVGPSTMVFGNQVGPFSEFDQGCRGGRSSCSFFSPAAAVGCWRCDFSSVARGCCCFKLSVNQCGGVRPEGDLPAFQIIICNPSVFLPALIWLVQYPVRPDGCALASGRWSGTALSEHECAFSWRRLVSALHSALWWKTSHPIISLLFKLTTRYWMLFCCRLSQLLGLATAAAARNDRQTDADFDRGRQRECVSW